ncbi:hypothetical protein [Daejeonella sp.]|uniref:hypothetical protein n=1 Tax=Daejeonella sp. TaxID=2805397 RepID=UPI0030BE3EAB
MKHLFKLLFLFVGISLLAASCNNTTETDDDLDSDTTNGVIDSMPEDNSASGDTAVVIDSIR